MSDHLLRASLPILAAAILVQSAGVRAESFEVVSYAPPPGWPGQILKDGRTYARPDGNGAIAFHVTRLDATLAPMAFTVVWRELIEAAVPGPAPEPQTRREGEFTVASGAKQSRTATKDVVVSLVTITGRGRTLGIVGMAGSDDAARELAAFFGTVKLAPGASASTTWGPPASGAPGLIGRWWKDAGGPNYFWYEFTAQGLYSYESPVRESRGTFRVDGNTITFTNSAGSTTTRTFSFGCVGGRVRLELSGESGYWSVHGAC